VKTTAMMVQVKKQGEHARRREQALAGVDGGVQQDAQQQVACAVEEPREEDGDQRADEQVFEDPTGAAGVEADDEQGKVPEAPGDAEQQRADQGAESLLQLREQPAAPAGLLPYAHDQQREHG
jgi:hypothetical protein